MYAARAVLAILKDIDSQPTAIEFQAVHENLFTVAVDVKTPGAGAFGRMAAAGFMLKEDVPGALEMLKQSQA